MCLTLLFMRTYTWVEYYNVSQYKHHLLFFVPELGGATHIMGEICPLS